MGQMLRVGESEGKSSYYQLYYLYYVYIRTSVSPGTNTDKKDGFEFGALYGIYHYAVYLFYIFDEYLHLLPLITTCQLISQKKQQCVKHSIETYLAETMTASASLHFSHGACFRHRLDSRKRPGKNMEPAARMLIMVPAILL